MSTTELFCTDTPVPAVRAPLFSTGVERHCLFRRPGDDDGRRGDGTHLHALLASLGGSGAPSAVAVPGRGVRAGVVRRRRPTRRR